MTGTSIDLRNLWKLSPIKNGSKPGIALSFYSLRLNPRLGNAKSCYVISREDGIWLFGSFLS